MELDVWVEGVTVKYEDIGSSQYFPYGHDAFYKVRDLIETGKYETDYIDAITRYAIVPKAVILTLIKSLYSLIDHLNKRLDTLYQTIEKLPDDKMYKLIQQEF
jgi:hypothetical protein